MPEKLAAEWEAREFGIVGKKMGWFLSALMPTTFVLDAIDANRKMLRQVMGRVLAMRQLSATIEKIEASPGNF